MDQIPRYTVLDTPLGAALIRIDAFGGERESPIAATVVVNGQTRLEIVAPAERGTWPQELRQRFQDACVLIATGEFPLELDLKLVFRPPHTGDDQSIPLGFTVR